jgi:putative DNA methylase
MIDDRRLIEHFLPVNAVGEAASSEPRTKGHISTLHVWRARRPLVACRAAVYGGLVPDDWLKRYPDLSLDPKNGNCGPALDNVKVQ